MKRPAFVVFLFFVFSCPSFAQFPENYQYFIDAQSMDGPTGNIFTPSSKVVPHKSWSFGLHRFVMGINYGLLLDTEIGINLDLKNMSPLFPLDGDNIARKKKEISLDSKIRILKEEEHPFDVSIGQRRDLIYLVCQKYFPELWDINAEGGLSWQSNKLYGFFSFTHALVTEQFLLDYDPIRNQYNLGWRFLISPEMKVDFFLIDCTRINNIFLDNFFFGISIVR
jgi:hypothetical protein